jgi:hypothetical protein
MAVPRIDISSNFTWEENLPRPQWDILTTWVESRVDADEQGEAWDEIVRQWFQTLADALPGDYCLYESEQFLLLSPSETIVGRTVLALAKRARAFLLHALPGVTHTPGPGKLPLVILSDSETYYQYVAVYYGEGHFGGSGGVCIREGYPHIVAMGRDTVAVESTIAHELTHACLTGLGLPLWIEEGLAQIAEHHITGRGELLLTPELAKQHKRHWRKHGLEAFWRGEGFLQPGKMQELSYQLAETLMRLLCEDYRPQWFGLVRTRQKRLMAFLRDADELDCGQASAEKHLGCGLGNLAAKFLGPGNWDVPW